MKWQFVNQRKQVVTRQHSDGSYDSRSINDAEVQADIAKGEVIGEAPEIETPKETSGALEFKCSK